MKASQCSLLAFQQIQFCTRFLCDGASREEKDGSIRKFMAENAIEIETALGKLMERIEDEPQSAILTHLKWILLVQQERKEDPAIAKLRWKIRLQPQMPKQTKPVNKFSRHIMMK